MRHNILIIEDDEPLAAMVAEYLGDAKSDSAVPCVS